MRMDIPQALALAARSPQSPQYNAKLAYRKHPHAANGLLDSVPRPAWKPSVTVAAVIELDGCFLLVEEQTREGIRINQPAGHLDPGESLVDAAVRETLEETACEFTPTQFLGVYMWRAADDVTYTRFAFVGTVGEPDPARALDDGIVRALWMSPRELSARAAEHRSPLVMRCIEDFLRGRRFPLNAIYTHPNVTVSA
jgi:8-oxo-dGTP pyrophosphatase MutT (NUDIX family)